MVIQHNIAAINSHRNYGINNDATSKNLEKLSSGYRINRAGDDAAGLAISEKMRGQIRGLSMAEQNTNHAINLIQTAEGGLQETHAILQRMRELAVQSSNGTYDNDVDRYNLEKEYQALMDEIDRIAESTHYNGIYLLNGDLGAEVASTTYTPDGTSVTPSSTIVTGYTATASTDISNTTLTASTTYTVDLIFGEDGKIDLSLSSANNGSDDGVLSWNSDGELVVTFDNGDTFTLDNVTDSLEYVSPGNGGDEGLLFQISFSTDTAGAINTTVNEDFQYAEKEIDYVDGTGLTFQIGANGKLDERVSLFVQSMDSNNIGTMTIDTKTIDGKEVEYQTVDDGYSIRDTTIAEQGDAQDFAIDVINDAINAVSSTRADLGALQNRLEHTLNNLGVTKENLTAAESTIRDVDMAAEMMEYTKNSILVQASQAMLAQANMLPQGVLQLLS